MNENAEIILESLAETIRRLRVDVMLLTHENERLKEEKTQLEDKLHIALAQINVHELNKKMVGKNND